MKKLSALLLAGVLAVLGLTMTACDNAATPTSMCAFVVNDGQNGHDSKIDHIAYPGDKIDTQDKNVGYFPCNARNYIVNDGQQKNANGDQVGDRFTPTVAYTKEGTEVLISWEAFWTVNQTTDVLKNEFYPFCYKYQCYTDDPNQDNANFASKGWNGMLGENFSQAGDDVLKAHSASALTDAVVQNHDVAAWSKLATDASNGFADAIRPYTGVADDLFCGSGNSGWTDPANPGKGTFTCSNVRFKISDIEFANTDLQDLANRSKQADEESSINQKELNAAKQKYGPDAGYWLGLQDTIKLCDENASCTVILGGSGSTPTITVPKTESAPAKQ